MPLKLDPVAGLTFPDNSTAATGGSSTPTGAFGLPAGTTAQRPVSPVTGQMRINTTTVKLEYYNGTAWKATDGSY
jgi:hypothetical protein